MPPMRTNSHLEFIENIIQEKIIQKILQGEPTYADINAFLTACNYPVIEKKFKQGVIQAVQKLEREELHKINAAIMRHSDSIIPQEDDCFMLRTSEVSLLLTLLRKEGELCGMKWVFDQEGNFVVPEIPAAILDHYATLKEHFYKERKSSDSLDIRIAKSITWIFYNNVEMLQKNSPGEAQSAKNAMKLIEILNNIKKPDGQYVLNLVESKISESCKHIVTHEEPTLDLFPISYRSGNWNNESRLEPSHTLECAAVLRSGSPSNSLLDASFERGLVSGRKIQEYIDNITKVFIPIIAQEIVNQGFECLEAKNTFGLIHKIVNYQKVKPILQEVLADQLLVAYTPELLEILLTQKEQLVKLIENNLHSTKVKGSKLEKVSEGITKLILKYLTEQHYKDLIKTKKNDLAEDNIIGKIPDNLNITCHDDSGFFEDNSNCQYIGDPGLIYMMGL